VTRRAKERASFLINDIKFLERLTARSQKLNVINVSYIQNVARSLPKRVNKWLYFKYLLTRQ
jgi:hypothetical protein